MARSAFFHLLAEHFAGQQTPPAGPNDLFASLGAPSVSVAVLDRGEIDACCFSTTGDQADTRFQACSISKAVAATAVFRLVDQGRIKVADKIADFLPPDVVAGLGPLALVREITIAQILSHSAGLTVSGFGGYSNDQEPLPSATDVVSGQRPVNTMPVRLVGIPGRQWSYSGGGYTLLQIAMESITSVSFPDLMEDLVLKPLKMTNSAFRSPAGEDAMSGYAPAYLTGVTPAPHWHKFPELAAAGLWTTPSDLLKLIHAIQLSLKGTERSFLKEETARHMLTEVQPGWMLGWASRPGKTPRHAFGHSGANDPGYRCVAMGFANLPEDGEGSGRDVKNEECGISVMTNSSAGITAAYTVLQSVFYLKSWEEGSTLSGGMPFVTPLRVTGAQVPKGWRAWEGQWSDDWVLEATDDGKPQARWRNLPPVRLLVAAIYPESYKSGTETSIDLVLDGLNGMMRLGWRGGERSIDYWDCLAYKSKPLKALAA